ncbi:MAG: TRAP transporter substrate-binding protein [Gammaproteobacteria bacterium]|nr:TRAP transporter substrate-binding protein [Gammaproteobacteria bacterium]
MKRRDFIGKLGLGAVAGSGLLASCTKPKTDCSNSEATANIETIHWKMVTTWPKNFPGLGTGAEFFAKTINELSGGRLQITVYGAGELVPAFEIFDFVSGGGAQLGHGSAYYWKGKSEAFQFFSTIPFGLTADEINAWMYHGGALELWREAYAPFGLIPMPCGNTTVQMAGWFNREINNIDDLKGLIMRIPGLGGEVLKRAGGTPVNLSGGELFTALQTGSIDATEWTGPYNDLAFGLYKAAKYYYYPGWHEPGTILECFVNKEAYEKLPDDLRAIVFNASRVANHNMQLEYIARNNQALKTLIDDHGVIVRRLPDDVLNELRRLADEVVAEIAGKDAFSRRVYESFLGFKKQVIAWQNISERAFLNTRQSS